MISVTVSLGLSDLGGTWRGRIGLCSGFVCPYFEEMPYMTLPACWDQSLEVSGTTNDTWRSTQTTLVIPPSSPPATSVGLDARMGGVGGAGIRKQTSQTQTKPGDQRREVWIRPSGMGEVTRKLGHKSQEPQSRSTDFEKSYFMCMKRSCWSINVKRTWEFC